MQSIKPKLFVAQPNDIEQEDESEVGDSQDEIKSLDDFIREIHPDNIETSENGLPSTDWIFKTFKTKSGAIRFLDSKGFKPKDIANHLGLRQQHVRNVLSQQLKRGPNETFDIETKWGCSHDKTGTPFIDVVLRKSVRDASGGRVLLRVCANCASGLIPGVDLEAIQKFLPGVKLK